MGALGDFGQFSSVMSDRDFGDFFIYTKNFFYKILSCTLTSIKGFLEFFFF